MRQFGVETGRRLRRPARQAKSPHHPSLVQVAGHLIGPLAAQGAHPPVEGLPEGDGQGARLVVAGRIGSGDHGAKIPQGDVVDILGRGLRPVAPLGGLEAGEEGLGHGDELIRIRDGAALGHRLLPFEVQGGTHRRDPSSQDLLGDGLLLGRERRHDGLAMGPSGAESSGPPLGADAAIRAAVRSSPTRTFSGGCRGVAGAALRPGSARGGARTVSAPFPLRPLRPWSPFGAIRSPGRRRTVRRC